MLLSTQDKDKQKFHLIGFLNNEIKPILDGSIVVARMHPLGLKEEAVVFILDDQENPPPKLLDLDETLQHANMDKCIRILVLAYTRQEFDSFMEGNVPEIDGASVDPGAHICIFQGETAEAVVNAITEIGFSSSHKLWHSIPTLQFNPI